MDGVLFIRGRTPRGGSLYFTCMVEYPPQLDAFLPSQLTECPDRASLAILPFTDGKGRFETDSLEHAEETEAEIGILLQTAYEDLQEMRRRAALWTGVKELALHQEEEAVENLLMSSLWLHRQSVSIRTRLEAEMGWATTEDEVDAEDVEDWSYKL